jgi:hypothetical protein
MESIISTILIPDCFRHYKRLYSIKDLISEIRDIIGQRGPEACKMCLVYNRRGSVSGDDSDIDDDDRVKFINRNGDHYTWSDLCGQCNGSGNTDYLGKLLSMVYIVKRDKFDEIINLFRVKFPYDILLKECELPLRLAHKHCSHYNEDTDDLCPVIIELIEKMANIKSSYWISFYNIIYIDYFIEKGCKIDLPELINSYIEGDSIKRIKKIISYCSDEEKIIKLAVKASNRSLLKRKINRLKLLGIKFIP